MSRLNRSGCPINVAMELLGDRWSLVILRDIMFKDQRGFNDISAANLERISPRVLANRIKLLTHADLVRPNAYGDDRRRIVYSLTESAINLAPVLVMLSVWAANHPLVRPAELMRYLVLARGGKEKCEAFMEELRVVHLQRLRMEGYGRLEVRPWGPVMHELKEAHERARR